MASQGKAPIGHEPTSAYVSRGLTHPGDAQHHAKLQAMEEAANAPKESGWTNAEQTVQPPSGGRPIVGKVEKDFEGEVEQKK